jgi:hypothetical protein
MVRFQLWRVIRWYRIQQRYGRWRFAAKAWRLKMVLLLKTARLPSEKMCDDRSALHPKERGDASQHKPHFTSPVPRAMQLLLSTLGPWTCEFLRPPDYRWVRAVTLYDGGKSPLASHDDDLINRAHRFLMQSQTKSIDQRAPKQDDPELWDAHNLYAGAHHLKRWLVESWILTGLPTCDVASRVGVATEVVQLYEQLFFDVRPPRQETDRQGAWL